MFGTFMKCVKELHILLNSDKNIETLHEDPSMFPFGKGGVGGLPGHKLAIKYFLCII